jgi:cation:H+ antiporter
MVVSFLSAIQGKADMAIGNVVGSNIFNTLLILGASAVVFPLTISRNAIRKDLPLNIGVTILLILLGLNFTIFGIGGSDTISRIDGIILLMIFVWYLWSSFKNDSADDDEEEGIKTYSPFVSCLLILGGLAALIFGGRLFVNSATEIAKGFGMSEKFIAITIMAAGTSMPELATSVVAAFKKKGQLALGNVIGSNISNILLILGGSALINPLSFAGMNAVDMGVLLGCTIFLLLFAVTFKKKQIDRVEGIILLLGMAAYMWHLISNL